MKRRRRGSGTIERTRDGRYRARFAFTDARREDVDGSPFASYEAAEAALDAILAELRDSGATRAGVTLRVAAGRALDLREKGGYRSVDGERDRWDAYLEEHELATAPIRLLTRGDARDLLASLRHQKTGDSLATSTKKNVLNLMRMILAVAVEDGRLEENVLLGMRVKESGTTEDTMRPLSLAPTRALLAVATDPVVAIAIGTGMRSGELRSLRWEDVHIDDASPRVMVRFGSPGKPRKNGKVLRVPLFGMALDAFRAMPKHEAGIVFPAVRGGYRAKGRVVERDAWMAWLKAAGIARRVRFHDLRHTCATLLLGGELGRKWTYEEVKELLGHSSVKVTEKYARVLGTLSEKAAAAMRRPKRKPAVSPQPEASDRSKAREILQRRGSDSNRRMTVLQTHEEVLDITSLDAISGRARAYVLAVAEGDPFAHGKGLELADLALDVADGPANGACGNYE